jgi:hypothetical protein
MFFAAKLVAQSTYVVTSAGDSNPFNPAVGELRWAIERANANPDNTIITFNIPGNPTTPRTIMLNSSLPWIIYPVIIDGNTQNLPFYTGSEPKVIIDGSNLVVGNTFGFVPGDLSYPHWNLSNGCMFSNLQLNKFTNAFRTQYSSNNIFTNNVVMNSTTAFYNCDGSSNNTYKGNYINTDHSLSPGSTVASRGFWIIGAATQNSNKIGGVNASDRNYIYNCAYGGIGIEGINSDFNAIRNNIFINDINGNIILSYFSTLYCGNSCKLPPAFQGTVAAGVTNIQGTALANDVIEIYKSNAGGKDALQLLSTVTANASGNFNATISGLVAGDKLIATATDPQNNTSEFSPAAIIIPGVTCPVINRFTYLNLNSSACTSIEYNASITNQSGQSATATINFGDGSPVASSVVTPTTSGMAGVHTFTTSGTYVVTIIIVGPGTCTTSASQTIAVTCNTVTCPTVRGANYHTDDCKPFDGSSCEGKCKAIAGSFIVNNPDTTTYNASVNYGDGSPVQNYTGLTGNINLFHNYAGGTYTVTTTLTGPGNCVSTYTFVVTITCTPPPCTDCIGSFAPIPDSTYIISAWVKEDGATINTTTYANAKIKVSFFTALTTSPGSLPVGSPVLASPTGIIIDGWQKIEQQFKIPAAAAALKLDLQSGGQAANFDDIRVFPFNGSMKGYVYDPNTMRLMAELDERNYATFYEYDEEGKLIRVK